MENTNSKNLDAGLKIGSDLQSRKTFYQNPSSDLEMHTNNMDAGNSVNADIQKGTQSEKNNSS